MKQTQPLANVLFMLNPQSVVQLHNITPAELMFLCAMHRKNAKKNPVEKLEVIPESTHADQLKKLQDDISKLEKSIENAETDPQINDDVRDKRVAMLTARVQTKERDVGMLQQIMQLRALNPVQERMRLTTRYDKRQVEAFFPGGVPSLPSAFEQAVADGSVAKLESYQFGEYMVGKEQLTGVPANA